ncbi:hypothetical protein Dimus_031554 [Dionaea muscipula]
MEGEPGVQPRRLPGEAPRRLPSVKPGEKPGLSTAEGEAGPAQPRGLPGVQTIAGAGRAQLRRTGGSRWSGGGQAMLPRLLRRLLTRLSERASSMVTRLTAIGLKVWPNCKMMSLTELVLFDRIWEQVVFNLLPASSYGDREGRIPGEHHEYRTSTMEGESGVQPRRLPGEAPRRLPSVKPGEEPGLSTAEGEAGLAQPRGLPGVQTVAEAGRAQRRRTGGCRWSGGGQAMLPRLLRRLLTRLSGRASSMVPGVTGGR